MKRILKKSLAVLLALLMLSSICVCFAAELNQDAVSAHYGQYKNYLLLGDSVASGYRDEMSDDDYNYNKSFNHTTYYRVPGSYADVLANAIIEDKSMTALAGPGFRTIEMRYMLEDDFAAEYEDPYLFNPSQLYVYDDQTCSCHNEKLLPGAEHFREMFKTSIAAADLITLGIGGNDWGAYLTWVIADILEAEHIGDQYMAEIKEILDSTTLDMATVEKVVEVAHLAGALRPLLEKVPVALENGLSNFYSNWDIMIQDIYDLNPDVTLMVLGMSDNGLKGKYFDYNGVEGEKIATETEEDATKAALMKAIVDFIMLVGNKPMVDGAKKFGYTYVDTAGTTYVDSHPDAAGHEFIANKIIEALPDREISTKFDDVAPGYKYYNAVEYVVSKGIMKGITDTTFGANETLTMGQLSEAYNVIFGSNASTTSDDKVTVMNFAFSLLGKAGSKGFAGFFKTVALTINVITDSNFKLGAEITRGAAASYIKTLNEI